MYLAAQQLREIFLKERLQEDLKKATNFQHTGSCKSIKHDKTYSLHIKLKYES